MPWRGSKRRHVVTIAVYAIGGFALGLVLAPLDGRHSWPIFTIFVVMCGYFSRSLGVVLYGSALASIGFWHAHHCSILWRWTNGGPDHNLTMVWLGSLFFFLPWAVLASAAFAAGQWVRRHGIDPGLCAKCGYDLRGLPSKRCPECGHDSESAASRVD
jgi:hypothetical protein